MTEFYVPKWEEIEDGVYEIAKKMVEDGFIPDAIVAILTGGVIPAKLLSDLLDIDVIKYVDIKFYRGVKKHQEKPVIKAIYAEDLENKKVLIIDDVADTGETLEAGQNVISMLGPELIKTATIYVKPWSRKFPDYYFKSIDKWIIFPWDKWDVIRENPEAPVDKKEKFFELNNKLKSKSR